jgi:hypothetical protein
MPAAPDCPGFKLGFLVGFNNQGGTGHGEKFKIKNEK